MGGMLTLIGTPPNLIVRDALVAAGYAPLTFFSFTPIGILCIVVGTLALIPLSRKFLKERTGKNTSRSGKTLSQLAEEYKVGQGLMAAQITPGSPMMGKTLKQLNVYNAYGVNVIEIRRIAKQGAALRKVEQFALADVELQTDDVLYLSGSPERINLLIAENALLPQKQDERCRIELLRCGYGRNSYFAHFGACRPHRGAGRFSCHLRIEHSRYSPSRRLFARRHQESSSSRFRHHPRAGPWDNIARLNKSDGTEWVVIGQPQEQAARVTLDYKAPLAALIMLLMVVAMAFDSIPIAPVTAVMLAAVAMIFTGCLRSVEAAYKTINWESIILFGAMLPMSTALEKTGASSFISTGLVHAVGDYGPYVLLAAIYLPTSLLTFFISNTVTAVLMAPIALSAATAQGVSAVPMLTAVTVAASMCFASPFSTPPNALVMSVGGYKPIDYIKVGLPLQIIMALVMIFALPLIYGF